MAVALSNYGPLEGVPRVFQRRSSKQRDEEIAAMCQRCLSQNDPDKCLEYIDSIRSPSLQAKIWHSLCKYETSHAQQQAKPVLEFDIPL